MHQALDKQAYQLSRLDFNLHLFFTDDGSSTGPTDTEGVQLNTYGAEGIVNRLGSQTSKWKAQVQEQRRNIYDRHAMLNQRKKGE